MLNNIRKSRLLKGVNQKELADELGVSLVTVSKWENGKSFPNVRRLRQVAKVLDTTVEKLLEDKERAM